MQMKNEHQQGVIEEFEKKIQRLENRLEKDKEEKEKLQKQLSVVLTENAELKIHRSLMVLSGYESKTEYLSYFLKPNGYQIPRAINMPSSSNAHHYLYASISALIYGNVYIFGGWSEYKFRIAVISGCEIQELENKLNFNYDWNSAALTAANQQSALLCFPNDEEWKKCEEFDGTSISMKPATKYSHKASCLAFLNDEVIVVSSWEYDGPKKVENFNGVSWAQRGDFPKAIYLHSCIGVHHGYLLFGGQYEDQGEYYHPKDVYLLRKSEWTVVGQLKKGHTYSSATKIGNTIYLVSGSSKPFAVEKLEWDGEKISSAKVISDHSSEFYRPIIFPVDKFYCA
ncbi:Oidioi.mRNA.OKI2018_I69.chr1.g3769.t1.cds [Oikopleura dioica]|uniref:Oidioi.mRNA.OKI2018_I69.chr1.g3769.t1.cds n=1 Tax=Oikopleura dioica TaxID=34765 RepID=A0ABN7SWX5_OIKDI|nr:Oidioi.mRNA.OKI2018_I69.chr1.g3769.t1.cds [Oikopleura dioica]